MQLPTNCFTICFAVISISVILISQNIKRQLPVLVYIHGGGLFAGTGGPSITGADYFMDTEDVIMVTMHYRLGPLGFLSTGDASMPGNFGLKDQAMAIKWVKDNIKAFGGNLSNKSFTKK